MIFLDREVQEYLENRFEKIRLLKQSAKGTIWLAADPTGSLVIWKTIRYTGLPYRWLKENHYDLWPKIIYLVEDETETTVIEEYVSGHSLQEVLDRKEYLAEKDVCRIAVQLCQGLAVLHRAGIIHRDIKPANLIWGNGIVRLLDFDAARVQKEEAQEDTVHLGTKGYAPPEQFGYGQTDARSDIYALGVTLLELLGPDYHGYLRPILKKCKEIDPKKRYQKVQSVQAAIRYHWRRRLLGGAALIVCVISLLLAGDYWWQVRQGNDPLPVIEQQLIPKEKQDEAEPEPAEEQPADPATAGHDTAANPADDPAGAGGKGGSRKKMAEKVTYRFFLNGSVWNETDTIMVTPDEWSNWQWKETAYDGDTPLPAGWNLTIHIENQSSQVLENPRVNLVYNREDHITAGTSLAPGQAEDITIPLGGYRVSDWNQFYLYVLTDNAQDFGRTFRDFVIYLADVGKYRQELLFRI